MANYNAPDGPVDTGIEVTNGPIWTKATVSSYTGNRETSPKMTHSEVQTIQEIIWDVIKLHKQSLDFAGEIKEHDIFATKNQEILVEVFIRHPEDMIGVKILWELAQHMVGDIKNRMGEPYSLRNLEIVSEKFVEQHHPEIV